MSVYKKINEKVSNKVFDERCQGREVKIKSSTFYDKGKKKKYDLISTLSVTLNPEIDLTPDCQRPLDTYDMAVHNAICTLWANGVTKFTTKDLYKVMAGDAEKDLSRSGNIKKRIENSLEKISWRKIKINFQEESEAYGTFYEGYEMHDGVKEKVQYTSIMGNMVQMVRREGVIVRNGQKCDAWIVTGEPLLYTYAKMKKQIGTLDSVHLNIENKLTEHAVMIREYLLGQVLYARGLEIKEQKTKKKSDRKEVELTVNFDDMFTKLKISNEGGKQKQRAIETVKDILNYWVHVSGLLKEYQIEKVKSGNGKLVDGKAIIKINSDKFILNEE